MLLSVDGLYSLRGSERADICLATIMECRRIDRYWEPESTRSVAPVGLAMMQDLCYLRRKCKRPAGKRAFTKNSVFEQTQGIR